MLLSSQDITGLSYSNSILLFSSSQKTYKREYNSYLHKSEEKISVIKANIDTESFLSAKLRTPQSFVTGKIMILKQYQQV